MKKLFSAIAIAVLAFGIAMPVGAQNKDTAPVAKKDGKECCCTSTPVVKKGVTRVVHAPFDKLPKADDLPQFLQDISVTIKAGRSEGSGVITNVNGVNYVWTAAHVVAGQRTTRSVIGPSGSPMTIVEFNDVEIIKDLVEDGRNVGSMRFTAEVLRYSDAEFGEDLALLRVRKKNLTPHVVHFHLDKKIPSLGSKLFHVGSLLGHGGSNSMTNGIMSQHGRVYKGTVYDQTTCAAFPGSSGGGVFLENGLYCGMIVRGAGETFNLIVPIRRMHNWAKKVGVDFTIDPKLEVPADETIKARPIEDNPKGGSHSAESAVVARGYNFLIRIAENDNVQMPRISDDE
jgi:hypothetical protein